MSIQTPGDNPSIFFRAERFQQLSLEEQSELREAALSILGAEKGSGDEIIKKAAISLLMKYHPDRNPDDIQAQLKFQEVHAALQILTDPHYKTTVNTPVSPNTPVTSEVHTSRAIFKTLKDEARAIGISEAFFQNLWSINKGSGNPERVVRAMLTVALEFYIGVRFPRNERHTMTIDSAIATLLADIGKNGPKIASVDLDEGVRQMSEREGIRGFSDGDIFKLNLTNTGLTYVRRGKVRSASSSKETVQYETSYHYPLRIKPMKERIMAIVKFIETYFSVEEIRKNIGKSIKLASQ